MSELQHEHHHEHTHDDTHSHEHHHTHTHDHEHSHAHSHLDENASFEEQLALLAYMLHHNEHHADELHELAHSFNGEAADLLHAAVKDFEVGNEKLAKALNLLKEGQK